MKYLYLLFFSFFSIGLSHAQIYNSTNGARSVGMGGASAAIRDVWAVQNNIAGISNLKNTEVSMYFQNRFGLAGLNYVSITSAMPLKAGAVGVSIDRFGNANLNEQRIGVGYAHNIDNVSLGGKINLMQISVKDVGTKLGVALEFGGIAQLTEDLVFGANIYNFNRAKVSSYVDERFSTVLKAGLSYNPFERLFVNIETEKNFEYDTDFKFGLDYMVREKLWIRSGVSTLVESGYFGVGFYTNKLKFDYALSLHSSLGVSNHVTFSYLISKSNKSE